MNITVNFTLKKLASGNGFVFKQKRGEYITLDELKTIVSYAIDQTDALISKGDNLTISIQTTESEETTP
jgi:hypothetical protein